MIFQNSYLASFTAADDLLIQFRKHIVCNMSDQTGSYSITQNITSKPHFDVGYMKVREQKITRYQYDMNYTMRLLFHYNAGWKSNNRAVMFELGKNKKQ